MADIQRVSFWVATVSGSIDASRPILIGETLANLGLQPRDHFGVAQGGHVSELMALGDVPEQATHDLARAGLGQLVRPDDALRPRELADALGDVLADLPGERIGARGVAFQRDERDDGLAGVLI